MRRALASERQHVNTSRAWTSERQSVYASQRLSVDGVVLDARFGIQMLGSPVPMWCNSLGTGSPILCGSHDFVHLVAHPCNGAHEFGPWSPILIKGARFRALVDHPYEGCTILGLGSPIPMRTYSVVGPGPPTPSGLHDFGRPFQ